MRNDNSAAMSLHSHTFGPIQNRFGIQKHTCQSNHATPWFSPWWLVFLVLADWLFLRRTELRPALEANPGLTIPFVNSYINRLANFVCTNRRPLAIALAFAAIAAGWGASSVEFDEQPRDVFARRGPAYQRLEQLFRDFGPDDNDVLIVIDAQELFTAESLSTLRLLADKLRNLDGVESLFSIFDVRRRGSRLIPLIPSLDSDSERFVVARDRALRHPIVAGHMLTEDARSMTMVLRLAGESLSVAQLEPPISEIRELIREFTANSDLRVQLTGHPAIRVDIIQAVRGDLAKFLLVSGIISAILGLVLFRHPAPVVIAAAGPAAGVLFIIGGMGFVGQKINGLNSVLPTLIFVIGFTDAVHLLFEMRRRRAAGSKRLDAVRDAIRDVGPACAMTSLTTAVGFGSLMIAKLEAVQRFGAACACGTLLCFVAVITVVPLLASTRLGDLIVSDRALFSLNNGGFLGKWISLRKVRVENISAAYMSLFRRPWIITSVSIIVTLGLFAMALRVQSEIRWLEMLPEENETAQVTRRCDELLGGTLLAHLVVEWPEEQDLDQREVLAVLIELHALIDEDEMLRGPFSVINLLRSFSSTDRIRQSHVRQLDSVPPHIRDRIVRRDLRRAVVTAHVPDAGAAALLPVFDSVEEKLREIESRHPGFQLQLTGSSVVAARNVYQIIRDLGKSLALATAIVFVVMTVSFRSIRFGLISVIPNAFPLTFAAALLVIGSEPLRLASAITFSICLGIAVDDTIHFLARFRLERLSGKSPREAIRQALSTVGIAMIVTSVILVGGFAAMTASRMPPIELFGQLASVAIIAALVGDLVILPALLLCFCGPAINASARE